MRTLEKWSERLAVVVACGEAALVVDDKRSLQSESQVVHIKMALPKPLGKQYWLKLHSKNLRVRRRAYAKRTNGVYRPKVFLTVRIYLLLNGKKTL